MESVKVEMKLVKAERLDQMRNGGGKARMNMPYWVSVEREEGPSETLGPGAGEHGALVFDFVGAHTDAKRLQELIDEGRVWVQEKYVI